MYPWQQLLSLSPFCLLLPEHDSECEKRKKKKKKKSQRKPLSRLLCPWNYNHQLSLRPPQFIFGHPTASSLIWDQICQSPVNLPLRRKNSFGHEAAGSSLAGGYRRVPRFKLAFIQHRKIQSKTWYHFTSASVYYFMPCLFLYIYIFTASSISLNPSERKRQIKHSGFFSIYFWNCK